MRAVVTLAVAVVTIGTAGHLTTAAVQPIGEIIRRGPAEFKELPLAVRDELRRRDCTIPQAYEPQARNVIRGNFFGAGHDWAVLCSRDGESSILVFRGAAVRSDMFRRKDADFLQTSGRGVYVFSRAIRALSPAQIREYERLEQEDPENKKGPAPTHDGIADAFQGKMSTAWYWYRNKWMMVGEWD